MSLFSKIKWTNLNSFNRIKSPSIISMIVLNLEKGILNVILNSHKYFLIYHFYKLFKHFLSLSFLSLDHLLFHKKNKLNIFFSDRL